MKLHMAIPVCMNLTIHHASPVTADSVRVRFIGDLTLADGDATLMEAMVGIPSSDDLQRPCLSSQSDFVALVRKSPAGWQLARTHG
jgi:hypothetical protein